jgi:5'-methylthioadenosine phosphorylase
MALGCDRVLALNSAAALHDGFVPGSFLLADDFIALGALPTSFPDERGQRVPGFDHSWRRRVLDAWRGSGTVPLHDGGVYWQVIGPRLETVAEVRLFAQHADVIGTTLASECAVAGELGLAYASVCVVDHLANGVGEHPLTPSELQTGRGSTQRVLEKVLAALVPALID